MYFISHKVVLGVKCTLFELCSQILSSVVGVNVPCITVLN